MRRAMRWLAVALCAGALLPTGPAAESVNMINGIGLIDYTRKPDFKVGQWVRYRVTSHSLAGAKDDYMVTVLIAGEETFWGDDGFWVETWTEPINGPPRLVAALMSYAIFDDSLPIPHMQLFMRKTIDGMNDDGSPRQEVTRRPPSTLKTRTPFKDLIDYDVDTLGSDTVSVPTGTFQCIKVRVRQGKGVQRETADSTVYTEVRDNRISYLSRQIPITSLARQEIEYGAQRRSWQIGHSKEAPPLHYLDRALGEARLVEFGEGLKGQVLPDYMQKTLPARRAAQSPPPPRGPQGKPHSATKKSG